MESDWGEKKIQALFSELRTAEEQVTPRFAPMWNRAQLAPRRVRAFNPAFVAVTVLLVFGLVSLGVWSQYSQRAQPVARETTPALVNAPPVPVTGKTGADPGKVGTTSTQRNLKRPRPIRFRSDERALVVSNKKLTRDAKAISSWSSPTSALLTSSSNEIFTSLPQLNKSASDLKSFLPSRSN